MGGQKLTAVTVKDTGFVWGDASVSVTVAVTRKSVVWPQLVSVDGAVPMTVVVAPEVLRLIQLGPDKENR